MFVQKGCFFFQLCTVQTIVEIFCETNGILKLVRVNCNLLHNPNFMGTSDSLQCFGRFLRNEPKFFYEMTTSWDKKTIRDLKQGCLAQALAFFCFNCCRQGQF